MIEERWIYDIRCRRCNDVSEWVIGPVQRFTADEIKLFIKEKAEHPIIIDNCEMCGYPSVCDVIGYRKINLVDETL